MRPVICSPDTHKLHAPEQYCCPSSVVRRSCGGALFHQVLAVLFGVKCLLLGGIVTPISLLNLYLQTFQVFVSNIDVVHVANAVMLHESGFQIILK